MSKSLNRSSMRCLWLLLALVVSVAASAWAQMPPNPLMIPEENFPDGFGAQGGTYTFAISNPPASLNPLLAPDNFASQQAAELAGVNVFPSLLDGFYEEPLQLTNGLLEVLELDDLNNPTRILMKLREGLRWSDGTAITSSDAEFTFAVHTDLRYRAYNGFSGLMISNRFPGFERLDDLSWVYHLPGPVNTGSYLSQLNALTLLPQHAHQVAFNQGTLISENYWSAEFALRVPNRIVGAGPFRLASSVAEDRWLFERNPFYWKADEQGTQLPYFDELTMLVVADRNVQFSMFINGELDRFSLQPSDLASLRGQSDNGIKTEVLLPEFNATANFISLNQDIGLTIDNGQAVSSGDPYQDSLRQLFRSVGFRRALSKASDRQSIVNNVFLGFATPIYQMSGLGVFDISGWPGGSGKLDPAFPLEFFEFDVAEANRLLDNLDLPKNHSGFRTFGQSYAAAGQQISITLTTNSDNQNRTLAAQLLAQNYADHLGLDFKLSLIPFSELLEQVLAFELGGGQVLGAWQSVYVGVGGGADAGEALRQLASDGFLHFYRYSDTLTNSPSDAQAQIDRLWESQNAIPTQATSGTVGGLHGYVFESPVERFDLIRELQLAAAVAQDNIYTVVANPLTAHYANRVGNVRKSALELNSRFKSLLTFVERGFRIKSRPGGSPDITP